MGKLVNLPVAMDVDRNADEATLREKLALCVNGYQDLNGALRKRPGFTEWVDLGEAAKVVGLFYWNKPTQDSSDNFLIAVCNQKIFKVTIAHEVIGTDTKNYRCKLNHTAAADNKPITGGSWATYWTQTGSAGETWVDGKAYSTRGGAKEDVTGGVAGAQLSAVNRVSFAEVRDNNWYVFLANGLKMIYATTGASFALVTDADAPTTVRSLAYLDTYMIAAEDGSRVFWWSDVSNTVSWNALSFATKEGKAGLIAGIGSDWKELLILGEETAEIWWNDGTTPFVLYEGGFTARGTVSIDTLARVLDTWVWLDQKGRLVKLEGRTPVVVSTPFDQVLQDETTLDDAFADLLEISGESWYVLTLPTANLTLAYDFRTEKWTQWGEWNAGNSEYDRMRWSYITFAKEWRMWLAGGKDDGKLYLMDSDEATNDGTAIRMQIRTAHVDHGTMQQKISGEIILRGRRGTQGGSTAGTADDTEASKLHDADGGFDSGMVGSTVLNTTDGTYTTVSAFVDSGELTLADDIFVSGEGYEIDAVNKMQFRWRDDHGSWVSLRDLEPQANMTDAQYIGRAHRLGAYRMRQWEFVENDPTPFALVGIEENVDGLPFRGR